jgi:hypothetical protein
MAIRTAVVAGQFYKGTQEGLTNQLKDCFLERRGYGTLPQIQKKTPSVKGLVVPHAGYQFSGPIASHAYATLAHHGFADTFIVLGPNHTGQGSGVSVITEGAWQTPLGDVPINSSLAKKLHTGIIDSDNGAHRYEHSIEVQLPFLQFISEDRFFDFVPLCMMMQDYETAVEVGTLLAKVCETANKNVCIIASSDFSHAGFNYRSMPPEGMRVDTYAEQQDTLAIEQILKLDPKGLITTVHEHAISMCGSGPVAAMLVATTKLSATKAELLKYGNSYEVYPNTSCVGYGALQVY